MGRGFGIYSVLWGDLLGIFPIFSLGNSLRLFPAEKTAKSSSEYHPHKTKASQNTSPAVQAKRLPYTSPLTNDEMSSEMP